MGAPQTKASGFVFADPAPLAEPINLQIGGHFGPPPASVVQVFILLCRGLLVSKAGYRSWFRGGFRRRDFALFTANYRGKRVS